MSGFRSGTWWQTDKFWISIFTSVLMQENLKKNLHLKKKNKPTTSVFMRNRNMLV